jgi:C2 domain
MSTPCCFSLLARLPQGTSKIDWVDHTNETLTSTDDADDYTSVDPNLQWSAPVAQHEKGRGGSQQDSKNQHIILMEIVGAMCLETKRRKKVDPYCTVRMYDCRRQDFKVVHRTDTIRNDGNPIWTAKTKSLCLIEIPKIETSSFQHSDTKQNSNLSTRGKIRETPLSSDAISRISEVDDENSSKECAIIEIMHGNSQLDIISTPVLGFVSTTPVVSSLAAASRTTQQPLGRVHVPFTDILRCCYASRTNTAICDRMEYSIKAPSGLNPSMLLDTASLALRFRFATDRDLTFLNKLLRNHSAVRESTKASADYSGNNIVGTLSTALWQPSCDDRKVAADINFRYVKTKALALSYKKFDSNGIEKFRVIPYPDPDRPDTTTWMSAAEMELTAYEPSTKWVTVGGGTLGTAYLEILGSNNLPQRDLTDFSQTDAVVAVAFEDNFVRTDVIWDQFYPRWMPWTTRAFQFNIRHPASLLCISVLDCDESILDKHDPIGRVVIRLSSFKSRSSYVLHYTLQDDPYEEPVSETAWMDDGEINNSTEMLSTQQITKRTSSRASIIIRLRIEWKDERATMKMFLTSPPRFIVNVDNDKSYEVLTYTTRGLGYMHDASIKSVKLLGNEILEYGQSFCFTMDVLMEILLWRGRMPITDNICIWFPIHSIVLYVGSTTLVERPDLIIPIFLFGIAWILVSLNYHTSHHPNPWLRVPTYIETICITMFGRRTILSSPGTPNGLIDITPNQGRLSTIQLEKLDKMKTTRMSALIQATMAFLLKVYYIYSKTGNKAIKITTDRKNKWNLLSSKLKYIHMFLLYMCQFLRLGRNFMSWQSNYTAVVTSYCIIFASAWCMLSLSTAVQWILRLLFFVVFGPWMKLVDIVYVHRWFATKDELLARIRNGEVLTKECDLPDFDGLLENKTFSTMIHMGRVKAEELYKLRDMRMLLFGHYSELIPFVENSRFPNIPLPQSTAIHTTELDVTFSDNSRGYHVPGQLLSGSMFHARAESVSISEDCAGKNIAALK